MATAAVEDVEHPDMLEDIGELDETETREPPPSYDTVAQKNNFFPEMKEKEKDTKETKKETKKEKKGKKKLFSLGKNNKPFRISLYRLVINLNKFTNKKRIYKYPN